MHSATIQSLLEAAFPGDHVDVQEQGGHYNVTVISAQFAGLRPVKCQQMVYAPLTELIASGDVHAVNIDARAPE